MYMFFFSFNCKVVRVNEYRLSYISTGNYNNGGGYGGIGGGNGGYGGFIGGGIGGCGRYGCGGIGGIRGGFYRPRYRKYGRKMRV